MSYAKHYNMRAGGYDFSDRLDIHALCTMAVNYARTGTLNMEAEGYEFSGNYDFRKHGLGQCRHPGLPRAMVKMAFKSASSKHLILEAEGMDYRGQMDFAAIVKVLTNAIKQEVPKFH